MVCVFFINHYTPLFSDDYLYSFQFNKGFVTQDTTHLNYERIQNVSDYFNSLNTLYQNLTGRIVAHGLLQLVLLFPPIVFDFVNTIAIFLLCYLMVRCVFGSNKIQIWLYVLLAFSFYYIASARSYSNLYVAAFSCNYVWTQIIILSYLYPFRRHMDKDKFQDKSYYFTTIMLFLGLIAGDTNEPVVPGVLLFVFFYIVYCRYTKRYIPLWIYSSFIGLTVGFAFLYFAPGNTQRLLYESSHNAGIGGVSFDLKNIKEIVFLSLSSLPIFIATLISILKFRKPTKRVDLIPLLSTMIILSGTIFAMLFIPLIINRFALLFNTFYVMIALFFFNHNNYKKPLLLIVIILLISPLLMNKLIGDYNRSHNAQMEARLFEKEIANAGSDSVLVTPRAYMEPLTRKNWSIPIAKYYNLKSLWIHDVLDSTLYKQSHSVTYNIWKRGKISDNKHISLSKIRYINHNRFSRTIYIDLHFDTNQISPKSLSINYFSFDILNRNVQNAYNRFPTFIQRYFLNESGEYRDIPYKVLGNGIRYAISVPNVGNSLDYIRIRLTHQGKVHDFYIKDISFE